MDRIKSRLEAFNKLGNFLNQFSSKEIKQHENITHNDLFFDGFKHQLKLAGEANTWFTKDNLLFAIEGWAKSLNTENLEKWIQHENLGSNEEKNVAIIMAGNIPLVGFHDFLSVLISGHSVLVKQSIKRQTYTSFFSEILGIRSS